MTFRVSFTGLGPSAAANWASSGFSADKTEEYTRICAEINHEYEQLFEQVKFTHQNHAGGYYYKEDNSNETANDFIHLIHVLLQYENITIDLIGTWLWVYGDTFPIRNELVQLGFHWNSKRQKWYYHSGTYHSSYHPHLDYNQMKEIFGCQNYQPNCRKEKLNYEENF